VNVFDSSALLTYLLGARGASGVQDQLLAGGCCSAASWYEVAQKVERFGARWQPSRMLLLSYNLVVEPVGIDDAEAAARLWKRDDPLSLADRLCLALGARLGATILTCDGQWAGRPGVVVVS
jgi:ribonuclease VapC